VTVFPFGQDLIDRGLHGDYMNLYDIIDLTVPRLKRTLLLGTRWADEGAKLVPAPGEPYYARYTYDPVGEPLATSQSPAASPPDGAPVQVGTPMPVGPILPITPPAPPVESAPRPPDAPAPIFAGPYPSTEPGPSTGPSGGAG
jgi:phospholipid/cholesterol/gamma-HCH transport system substrate-binding protein